MICGISPNYLPVSAFSRLDRRIQEIPLLINDLLVQELANGLVVLLFVFSLKVEVHGLRVPVGVHQLSKERIFRGLPSHEQGVDQGLL